MGCLLSPLSYGECQKAYKHIKEILDMTNDPELAAQFKSDLRIISGYLHNRYDEQTKASAQS